MGQGQGTATKVSGRLDLCMALVFIYMRLRNRRRMKTRKKSKTNLRRLIDLKAVLRMELKSKVMCTMLMETISGGLLTNLVVSKTEF